MKPSGKLGRIVRRVGNVSNSQFSYRMPSAVMPCKKAWKTLELRARGKPIDLWAKDFVEERLIIGKGILENG